MPPMLAWPDRGAPAGLRSHPSNLIRFAPAKGVEVGEEEVPRRPGFARPELCTKREARPAKEGAHGGTRGSPVLTGEGSALIPTCLTIAGSDSGGGAGIQADQKAFAAAGCHGMSAIVALTAQNTTGVTAVHEVPREFLEAQLEAVFSDLGVDAAKTGMLFSAPLIETTADFLAEHPVPLVVDPVLVASSGARLL